MPYIGAKELKASDIRRFDVTGSTNAGHTLTWTPPNEQSLIVTINGVKQHGDSYSVSGNTLTLSSSLVATDKLEVIGINDIGTTITPAQNSVDADKIADNAVTTAKIADDQITSAKLANAINITSGNSLTIDSGATITNNGTASGFADAGGQVWAAGTSVQTVTTQVVTKVTFTSSTDPDGLFSSNTYTVPSDGLYWVWGGITHRSNTIEQVRSADTYIYINGSSVANLTFATGYYSTNQPVNVGYLADLSTSDTIELYGKLYGGGTLYFDKRYLAIFRIK
jgi:hypothetical protein